VKQPDIKILEPLHQTEFTLAGAVAIKKMDAAAFGGSIRRTDGYRELIFR